MAKCGVIESPITIVLVPENASALFTIIDLLDVAELYSLKYCCAYTDRFADMFFGLSNSLAN